MPADRAGVELMHPRHASDGRLVHHRETRSGFRYALPARVRRDMWQTISGNAGAGAVMDARAMRRALLLAAAALGRTSPNPAVGAVIVDANGTVVGEGATRPYGQAHAEPVALELAGERARGATLYATLEPCSHHGKTPPCADAIVAAGVARVVVATLDPNPRVAGRGVARLQSAGIAVEVGLGSEIARTLMAGFATWIETRRPHVIAKFAASLDGRIATHSGDSRWISGPEARRWAHGVRDHIDAIMVGIGTVLADDPALTHRGPSERGHSMTSTRGEAGIPSQPNSAPSQRGASSDGPNPPTPLPHEGRGAINGDPLLGGVPRASSVVRLMRRRGLSDVRLMRRRGLSDVRLMRRQGLSDPLPTQRGRSIPMRGGGRQPLRVVLDSHLRSPTTSQVASGVLPGTTLIVGIDDGTSEWRARRDRLANGDGTVEVATTLPGVDGRPDVGEVLDLLGARGITTLLVEGGATVHDAFFRAGLVDRVAAVIAPLVIGGGPSAVGTAVSGPARLADAARLQDRTVTVLGDDILVTGWLRRPSWID